MVSLAGERARSLTVAALIKGGWAFEQSRERERAEVDLWNQVCRRTSAIRAASQAYPLSGRPSISRMAPQKQRIPSMNPQIGPTIPTVSTVARICRTPIPTNPR